MRSPGTSSWLGTPARGRVACARADRRISARTTGVAMVTAGGAAVSGRARRRRRPTTRPTTPGRPPGATATAEPATATGGAAHGPATRGAARQSGCRRSRPGSRTTAWEAATDEEQDRRQQQEDQSAVAPVDEGHGPQQDHAGDRHGNEAAEAEVRDQGERGLAAGHASSGGHGGPMRLITKPARRPTPPKRLEVPVLEAQQTGTGPDRRGHHPDGAHPSLLGGRRWRYAVPSRWLPKGTPTAANTRTSGSFMVRLPIRLHRDLIRSAAWHLTCFQEMLEAPPDPLFLTPTHEGDQRPH